MAVDRSFHQLFAAVADACLELARLKKEVLDTPPGDRTPLADQLEHVCEDLCGWASGAAGAAHEGAEAAKPPHDFAGATERLAACHEALNELWQRFVFDLMRYTSSADFKALPRQKPAWSDWAAEVQQTMPACQRSLCAANKALVGCWRELADRAAAGGTSVNVRSIAVGQRVTVPGKKGPAWEQVT